MFNKSIKTQLKKSFLLIGSFLGVVVIIAISSNIDNVASILIRAFGTPANIIVDAQGVTGRLNKPWKNIAQGGESPNYSFAPVRNHLLELDTEFIRIDHIYDFYDIVKRNPDHSLSFDFTKLDQLLLDITSAGATPFISLSYMPPELSKGDIIGKPNDYHEWSVLVQNTIQHISGKAGLNLSNVYYEVWNEPDLFGKWKLYGEKNYLHLYHYAALGAMNTTNTNKYFIGGPATTNLYPNWVTSFLDYIKANNLPLDFYSWHLYSPQVDDYANSIQQFDQLMRRYPEFIFSVKPMITEWGHDSQNNIGYDTALAASHLIAVASQIQSLDKAFLFELQDGKDPEGKEYWGRWGMLTHSDFGSRKKPRYFALKALNQLGDQKLSIIGEGTWVKAIASKSSSEGSIRIILTNYDPKSKNTETVPITIKRLTDGNYTLFQQYINRPPTTSSIRVQAGTYHHSIVMPPNSSALLVLSPQ